jgi:hypothetical protein
LVRLQSQRQEVHPLAFFVFSPSFRFSGRFRGAALDGLLSQATILSENQNLALSDLFTLRANSDLPRLL